MLKHFFQLTLRHMWAQQGTTFINVLGLGVGIAVALLISLYIAEEHRYDRFHEQAERLFRVNTSLQQPNGRQVVAYTGAGVGTALDEEVSGIAEVVRFKHVTDVVRTDTKGFSERITFADPALLSAFSFPLRSGSAEEALARPDAVVLTDALAHKYFGEQNPVGQTLAIKLNETFYDFTITAVVDAFPGPSSIAFDLAVPFNRWADVAGESALTQWRGGNVRTYVQLAPTANPTTVAAQFPKLVQTHIGAEFLDSYQYQLQPIAEIHLDPTVVGGMVAASDPLYSYILGSLALLILVLAAVNFTNLSIAAASRRAKEIGLRKAVGAHRHQLIVQFWGEALLVSVLAAGIGAGLAELLLPVFNSLAQTELVITWQVSWLVALVVLVLLTGCLAGSYPAIVLSAFRPSVVLKGGYVRQGRQRLTKTLVTAQFVLSVALLTGAFIMQEQLSFLKDQPLGFDQSQIVAIPTHTSEADVLLERYRSQVAAHPSVHQVTGTSAIPGRRQFGTGYVEIDAETYLFPKIFRVDSDFYTTLAIPTTRGRTFDAAFPTDATAGMVINEAFVRHVGWDDPLGQTLTVYGQTYQVIGVTQDFHLQSLHQPLEPTIMLANPTMALSHLLVRVEPTAIRETLAFLEETWQDIVPNLPFEAFFLDEDFERQYAADERWGQIIRYASVLAMLIAGLGLFGLTFLTAAQRTKEIGIRKVLGATSASLVVLLSKDLLRLVAVASVIAAPGVYFLTDRWLQTFAHRMDVGWSPFVLGTLALLGVAMLATSYHALRTAQANPVDALRYE